MPTGLLFVGGCAGKLNVCADLLKIEIEAEIRLHPTGYPHGECDGKQRGGRTDDDAPVRHGPAHHGSESVLAEALKTSVQPTSVVAGGLLVDGLK